MNNQKNSILNKNTKKLILVCFIILLFSACFTGWKSSEGTIIINLGGEGRAAWPPSNAMLSQMDYTVTLSGNGEKIKQTVKGGGTIRATVSVGRWNVQVDASYEKEPYASGSAFVEVKAGQNNQVSIRMSQAIKFYKEFYAANESEWNKARTAIAGEPANTGLNYAINITGNFSVQGLNASLVDYTINISGINVYIRGNNHTISLNSQGYLLRVAAEQTVVIQDVDMAGLTSGKNNATQDNNNSLVYVTDGILIMNGGTIRDNTNTSYYGGVNVYGGTFIMNSGAISGNIGASVGGVNMSGNKSEFIMNGGAISTNDCSSSTGGGGGVHLSTDATFTMNGGTINDNSAGVQGSGGGVKLFGTFNMNGGEISGNKAYYAGGLYIDRGVFNMKGGTISGNTGSTGGSLYLQSGLYMQSGAFNMIGGIISGNTGGIFIENGSFRMTGGTVYGSDAGSELGNKNYTLYVNSSAEYGKFSIPDEPSSEWKSNGSLNTTDETIRVVNGVLNP